MYDEAAEIIRNARRVTAFTGAGISVESGIPPFRGEEGLWSRYDPTCLDITYFNARPEEAWVVIREIFYDFFGRAKANLAHRGLAVMEANDLLHTVITQNIDNLHQEGGSREVWEFHGTAQQLVCAACGQDYHVSEVDLKDLPPRCGRCEHVLKPDFVFFGEPIPERVHSRSLYEAQTSDVFLVIGTTGEVTPASLIPPLAKRHGAHIIEINPEPSAFTDTITDVFLQAKATEAVAGLLQALGLECDDDATRSDQ